jgi:hypothetical protein
LSGNDDLGGIGRTRKRAASRVSRHFISGHLVRQSVDELQSWQAIDLVMELYPSEPRAIAELLTALHDRHVVSFGIPVQCWRGEGAIPIDLPIGSSAVRLSHFFWGEIPESETRAGKHMESTNGDFGYARWTSNEFGYQWILSEGDQPDFTCLERYEFVGISRYTLRWFIDDRRKVIASMATATEAEIKAFIQSTTATDVNRGWNAFRDEFGPRSKSLSDSFKKLWPEVKGYRSRGRPKFVGQPNT